MALIKSHSNYVLKSKHQVTNDGTIWERDITTIGGISDFPSGQIPVYKSGNFIISVRADKGVNNKYTPVKWKANNSGETWTIENVGELSSVNNKYQDDTKIVLKQDYYDFRDFAYYGSLTELMRASIGDILVRFPGELYLKHENCTYTEIVDGVPSEKIVYGDGHDDDLHKLLNPFGIDLHSKSLPESANTLKYFADSGWENYEICASDNVDNPSNWHEITSYTVDYREITCAVPGTIIAVVTLSMLYRPRTNQIYVYIDDDNKVAYGMVRNGHVNPDDNSNATNEPFRLRPKKEFLNKFYDECDNFQRLLVNPNTSPKYKATFSVIKENNYGYYRRLEDFIFPTGDGDYNLDVTTFGFNDYTGRLAKIGEFYDERFSDNMYRAMTHESIKNFDWTRSRDESGEIDTDIILGADRMKKALRIMAREFDEVKSYIDGIRNVNSVTYDERNNLPDYFLADTLSDDGWDVRQVYPYRLSETTIDTSGATVPYDDYSVASAQTRNCITRNFYQDTASVVRPYHTDDEDGYVVVCSGCSEEGEVSAVTITGFSAATKWDECSNTTRFRMSPYHSDKEYSIYDVGNQFMRNLKINSRQILRHKGTVEGIEMLLALFGLKSYRWSNGSDGYDFTVEEYSMKTRRLYDPYSDLHGMNRFDWYNSTKILKYDYRSESDIYDIGADTYVRYQGLPVSWRRPYVHKTRGASTASTTEIGNRETLYDDVKETVTSDGVFLYPHFSKNEKYDGDPYFQMNGGWLSRRLMNYIANADYNFSFDVDNNFVFNKHLLTPEVESGYTFDNHPLYTETVNTIRSVADISELLAIPSEQLHNSQICYVDTVANGTIVIDGKIYEIQQEVDGDDNVHSYVSFEVYDGELNVGDETFLENVSVYDENGDEVSYYIPDKYDGYRVKAYVKDGTDFVCHDGAYTIGEWFIVTTNDDDTNYFIIDDVNYSYMLSDGSNSTGFGWRRLSEADNEYKRLKTITNYYKGNNPHSGLMQYDNGHEYLTYFKRLFKYAYDNDKFDERCYDDYFQDTEALYGYGFKGLIDDDERLLQYDSNLISESDYKHRNLDGTYEFWHGGKIHYFGAYKTTGSNGNRSGYTEHTTDIYVHTCDKDKLDGWRDFYQAQWPSDTHPNKVHGYTFNGWTTDMTTQDVAMADDFSGYTCSSSGDNDDVTDLILNTKRIILSFNLHNKWYSKEGQSELKYLDEIVMNYLTQVIPSTTILEVIYIDGYSTTDKDWPTCVCSYGNMSVNTGSLTCDGGTLTATLT